MNILLVSELFPFCDAAGELQMLGGGENHMYALGRELSGRHHVAVLTSHVPAATYPEDRFPFHVYTIYNRKTAGKRAANLRYACPPVARVKAYQQPVRRHRSSNIHTCLLSLAQSHKGAGRADRARRVPAFAVGERHLCVA